MESCFPNSYRSLYPFIDACTFEEIVTNSGLCRLALKGNALHSQPRPEILVGQVAGTMGGPAAKGSMGKQAGLVFQSTGNWS